MGSDDHGAAGVLLRDLAEGGIGPRLHIMEGLGPRHGKMLLIVHEAVEDLRLVPDHVCKGNGLPGADVDLPQASVRLHGQIVIFRDG